MRKPILMLTLALASTALAPSLAFADCESDMVQLEAALKAPNLTPEGKAALKKASVTSVAAMKKDDDTACHKAIADAMPKAGLTLK